MKNCCNGESCGHCSCRNFKYGKNQMAHGGNAVYGLGIIGSLIYFISTAPDFWMGVFGIFKAIFWPAFMVYEAFKVLLG